MSSTTQVSLKVAFQDEIRRILVSSTTDFQTLFGKLKGMFNVTDFKLQYKDSENDLITIASDEEMEEAFRLAQLEVPHVLRLCVSPKAAATSPVQPPQHPLHPPFPHHWRHHGVHHGHHGRVPHHAVPAPQQQQQQQPHSGCPRFRGPWGGQGRCGRRGGPFPMFGQPTPQDIHVGIVCDGCQQYPLIGARYKCADCPDFDLCESCFSKDVHRENNHAFLKISSRSVEALAERTNSAAAAEKPAEAEVESKPAEPAEPAVESEVEVEAEKPSAPPVEEEVKKPAEVAPVDVPKAVEPVAAPAAPAAAQSEPNNRFEQMLSTLADMGFVDRPRNIATLVRHRGNLVAAIQELLSSV